MSSHIVMSDQVPYQCEKWFCKRRKRFQHKFQDVTAPHKEIHRIVSKLRQSFLDICIFYSLGDFQCFVSKLCWKNQFISPGTVLLQNVRFFQWSC